jgi:hypothetical protein
MSSLSSPARSLPVSANKVSHPAIGSDRFSVVAPAGWLLALSLSVSAASQAHEVQRPVPADARQAKSMVKAPLSKPLWRDLDSEQHQALHPLGAVWDGLSEAHKRKWLALSRNHAKLTPAEQAVQHSRMADWAALGVRERAQARFNFVEVKQLPAAERKAKWEVYQALSAEEKRKLAERAPVQQPLGVAPTIRPVPAHRLAPVPFHEPSGAIGAVSGETAVATPLRASQVLRSPATVPAGDRAF